MYQQEGDEDRNTQAIPATRTTQPASCSSKPQTTLQGTKNQPDNFQTEVFFCGRPRGMSVPKRLFFQNLEGLAEVFGRMCSGTSG